MLNNSDFGHPPPAAKLIRSMVAAPRWSFFVAFEQSRKWLIAPKGSAFLYAAKGREHALEPLVVSHGWTNARTGSKFLDNFTWTGTVDPAAYIRVSLTGRQYALPAISSPAKLAIVLTS